MTASSRPCRQARPATAQRRSRSRRQKADERLTDCRSRRPHQSDQGRQHRPIPAVVALCQRRRGARLRERAIREEHERASARSAPRSSRSCDGSNTASLPARAVENSSDSATDTLRKSAGICRDYTHVVIALARALGTPARYVDVFTPGLKVSQDLPTLRRGVRRRCLVGHRLDEACAEEADGAHRDGL